MSKQTAVDWFFDKMKSHFEHDGDLFETVCMTYAISKVMEKEQIIEAVDSIELVNRRYYKDGTFVDDKAGKEIQMTGREYIGLSTDGKAYYNETYGGDK